MASRRSTYWEYEYSLPSAMKPIYPSLYQLSQEYPIIVLQRFERSAYNNSSHFVLASEIRCSNGSQEIRGFSHLTSNFPTLESLEHHVTEDIVAILNRHFYGEFYDSPQENSQMLG